MVKSMFFDTRKDLNLSRVYKILILYHSNEHGATRREQAMNRIYTILMIIFICTTAHPSNDDLSWTVHIIDQSSQGADGVRVLDVNNDGLPDITTGWEEGGVTKAYLHPGYDRVKNFWPSVKVGLTPSVEDAVFADLDSDGSVDIVSCCEGDFQSVNFHWAPKPKSSYLDSSQWVTTPLPACYRKSKWMFALPMDIDQKNGIDLVVGSKSKQGMMGWLESPANAREVDQWKLHKFHSTWWIMSIINIDMDRDGDQDILFSNRKGESGVYYLENPGSLEKSEWSLHLVGAAGKEVMFLDVCDLNNDGKHDILAAVRPDEIYWFREPDSPKAIWKVSTICVDYPAGTGTAKGIRCGDIDGDGRLDIVYSCEHAGAPKRGVVWLKQPQNDKEWQVFDISGPLGIKFDRIELLDLDGDGDLDVLTCEERERGKGMGIVWYENPAM
jgi:hypothetical protein